MDSASNLYNLSSPSLDVMKQGTQGQIIELMTNSVQVKLNPNWKIYSYRVAFEPTDLKISTRKKLLLQHSPTPLGSFIHEGSSILCFQLLTEKKDAITLQSMLPDDGNPEDASIVVPSRLVTITLTWAGEIPHDSPRLHGVYNKMIRKLFGPLGLKGVKYEDKNAEEETFTDSSVIRAEKLFIAHGLVSVSFRPHETKHPIVTLRPGAFFFYFLSVLNNVELVMEEMKKMPSSESYKRQHIEEKLIGKKVHAKHVGGCFWNRIVGVTWEGHGLADNTPYDDTLKYMEAFERKHGFVLESDRQPLIQLIPLKPIRRDNINVAFEVPAEVCLIEGLNIFTDEPGPDFDDYIINTKHELEVDPSPNEFMAKFLQQLEKISPRLVQQFDLFQMDPVSMEPLRVVGRVLPPESLVFKNPDPTGRDTIEVPNASNDFLDLLEVNKFLSPVEVLVTLIIAPRCIRVEDVNGLINDMGRASRSLGISMQMAQTFWIYDWGADSYSDAIVLSLQKYGKNLRVLIILLETHDMDFYAKLKKICTIQFEVFSYFYSARNVISRNPKGVQKLVVDINASLGGEAFKLAPAYPPIPEVDVMVVGCGTFQNLETEPLVLAMTATTCSRGIGKLFSAVALVSDQEVEDKIGSLFHECVTAWFSINQKYPRAVVFYREDLRRDQLFGILEKELEPLQNVFIEMGVFVPINYVVVGRRTHSALLVQVEQEFGNPPVGTVLDNVLTTAECFDFFLISHALPKGTIRPTYYEVLFNGSKFTADQIHRFTFRQCHLSFTAGKTTRVPAVCHYAKKLARFTGEITKKEIPSDLSLTLNYLDYKQYTTQTFKNHA